MIFSTHKDSSNGQRDLGKEITAALDQLHIPSLRRVRVEVSPEVVVLRGEVNSFYAKQVSQHSARRLAGDRQVIDEVRVATPADLARTHRPGLVAGAVRLAVPVTVDLTPGQPPRVQGT